MIFLFFLVLVLFGPKKIPEIARELGKLMAEFRRASNDFKQQLTAELDQDTKENPPTLQQVTQNPASAPTAPERPSFTQTLLPAGVKTAISEIDNAHDRLMKTARMAFEAQNFTLRPPETPTVAAEETPAEVAGSTPAPAESTPAQPEAEAAPKTAEDSPAQQNG